MNYHLRLAILIPLSIAAFYVLFILPDMDLGWVGGLALLAAAWVVWYLLWRTLREWTTKARESDSAGDEDTIAAPSPGEWRAWVGLLFTAAILVYYALRGSLMVAADGTMAPEASAIGTHIGMLVIGWLVVMRILRKYWHDTVEQDERDHQIQARASRWARGGLSVFMLGLAVMFAFTPLDHLRWAVPMTLSNMLMAALIATSLIEYLVSGICYWRDRRAVLP